MYCSICKYSRKLKYIDNTGVRLLHENDLSNIEILRTVPDCLYCVSYGKIVDAHKDDYCERSNSIFDDELY